MRTQLESLSYVRHYLNAKFVHNIIMGEHEVLELISTFDFGPWSFLMQGVLSLQITDFAPVKAYFVKLLV